MAVGPGTIPGEGAEQEYGDLHVAVVGANEVMRASLERQVFLTDAVHGV